MKVDWLIGALDLTLAINSQVLGLGQRDNNGEFYLPLDLRGLESLR